MLFNWYSGLPKLVWSLGKEKHNVDIQTKHKYFDRFISSTSDISSDAKARFICILFVSFFCQGGYEPYSSLGID